MDVAVIAEERYWYPDDGGAVWLAGYTVVDPETGAYLARDAPELLARGLRVAGVAGAGRHHPDAHDANAIAVELPGGEQLGFVPRELAAELAPRFDAGEAWSAVALRESRAS